MRFVLFALGLYVIFLSIATPPAAADVVVPILGPGNGTFCPSNDFNGLPVGCGGATNGVYRLNLSGPQSQAPSGEYFTGVSITGPTSSTNLQSVFLPGNIPQFLLPGDPLVTCSICGIVFDPVSQTFRGMIFPVPSFVAIVAQNAIQPILIQGAMAVDFGTAPFANPVPESGSLVLLASGLLSGAGWMMRSRIYS